MDAGRAGLRTDLVAFKSELQKSLATLDSLRPRAEAVIAELDRRAEAHKLFLRLISAGQISAFALTEPSAGSDSGGIQTRAELKKVEVLTDADGVKYFMLGNDRKNIIDAATIDLSKIDYSEYDYKTDDPTKFRYYQHNGKRIPIHDIAQIRREGDKEFYEYYELNGAKMWITNGHVAGVFCLYARTKEGPTGFMVDRHAEGLVVGKDEEKMGQRGSPTNELGLTSVRVPRENVIGIEGRGQVNALETLNVGRLGLCVSAVSMMAKIVEQTRAFILDHKLDKEEWVLHILGGMATELYATESLAYELIGRADHHGTKSVRTESAIGKYYASEALHRTIRAAEKIHGHRRLHPDARIGETPPRRPRPQHLRGHQRSATLPDPARPRGSCAAAWQKPEGEAPEREPRSEAASKNLLCVPLRSRRGYVWRTDVAECQFPTHDVQARRHRWLHQSDGLCAAGDTQWLGYEASRTATLLIANFAQNIPVRPISTMP